MATAAAQLKTLATKISKETNVKPEDVEKVLKAGYISTMEFVVDRIKAEMTKSRTSDVGAIEKLKSSPVVRDVQDFRST